MSWSASTPSSFVLGFPDNEITKELGSPDLNAKAVEISHDTPHLADDACLAIYAIVCFEDLNARLVVLARAGVEVRGLLLVAELRVRVLRHRCDGVE